MNLIRKKWFSAAAVAIILLAVLAGVWRFVGSPRMSDTDSLIRQATPRTILNHVRDLHSPVVLLNFWASWCEPCKAEFPDILRLRQDLAPRGLRVVLVSVDEPDDLGAAIAFLKSNKVDFPTFYKGSQSLNFVTEIWPDWHGAVPATVLLGPDLKILDAWEGDTSLDEFRSRVEKHLKGT
jgi:thiol-disulfide isomerase/thioredoxin